MPLIDPSLLDSLGFLFNKTVTIQEATDTQDAFGAPTSTWANKTSHVAIPCVLSPTGTSGEVKRPDMTYVVAPFKFMLQGYYPLITEKMRAVCGSRNYDILLAKSDSQDVMTTLLCEVVT